MVAGLPRGLSRAACAEGRSLGAALRSEAGCADDAVRLGTLLAFGLGYFGSFLALYPPGARLGALCTVFWGPGWGQRAAALAAVAVHATALGGRVASLIRGRGHAR